MHACASVIISLFLWKNNPGHNTAALACTWRGHSWRKDASWLWSPGWRYTCPVVETTAAHGMKTTALNMERNNSSTPNHHSIAYYMLGWAILTKAFTLTCIILTLGVRWCIGTQCTMYPISYQHYHILVPQLYRWCS